MNLIKRRQFAVIRQIVSGIVLSVICFTQTLKAEPQWDFIPSNISVLTEPGKDYAIVNYGLPTVTDTSGVVIRQINGFVSGAKVPVGEFVYQFSAEDTLGNAVLCSFSVEVKDEELPVITGCPTDISAAPDVGMCSKIINFAVPSFSDNSLWENNSLLPGDILFTGVKCDSPDSIAFVTLKKLPIGTELSITDKGWLKVGGFRSGEGILIWKANSEISAGTEVVIEGLNANIGECSGSSLSLSASGDQLFIYSGTQPAEGGAGNFICGIQLNSSAGSTDDKWDGDATATTTTGKPGAIISGFNGLRFSPEKDNVAYNGTRTGSVSELQKAISDPANWLVSNTTELSIKQGNFVVETPLLQQTLGLAPGSSFPVGTTINRFEITDHSGNSVQCSFIVEITDTTKPKFNSVTDIIVNTDAGNCSAVVSYNLPIANDACGNLTYELLNSKSSGEIFPLGETMITLKVSDESGNADTTSFKIIVEDKTSPEINLPENITTIHSSGKGSVAVNYSFPTAVDNCSGVNLQQIGGLGSGSLFPPGVTTETFRATDGNGNSKTSSFTITVKENNSPQISFIDKIEFNEDEELSVKINFSDPDPSDNHSMELKISNPNLTVSDKQVNGGDANFKLRTASDYYGETALTIELNDNSGAPNCKDILTVPVKILPVNDPPVCRTKSKLKLNEGERITITDSLFEISDIDSPVENLKVKLLEECKFGKVFNNSALMNKNSTMSYSDFLNENLIYVHSGAENAQDTIYLCATDGEFESDSIKIPIEVILSDDPPIVSSQINLSVKEDEILELDENYFSTIIKDDDTEFSKLKIVLRSDSILVIIKTGDKKFSIKPKRNWFGELKCLFIVTDERNQIKREARLNVVPVNDHPEFLTLPGQIVFDNSSFAEINMFDLVEDPETKDDELGFEINKPDSVFWKFDQDDGSFIITAAKGFCGKRKLRIKVEDPELLSAETEIEIIVNNITNIGSQTKTPFEYKLHEAYPNPFNPVTKINYEIPERRSVTIKVSDILGRDIKTLVNKELEAGKHTVSFDGSNLSSGLYFVIMKAGKFVKVKKVLLMK